jgi:hypothetical protein
VCFHLALSGIEAAELRKQPLKASKFFAQQERPDFSLTRQQLYQEWVV